MCIRDSIRIQPCCKLGEADKITRPACDIRIEDIHAILFDGIEQLPVVPFQDTAQAFIGSCLLYTSPLRCFTAAWSAKRTC